MAAPGGAWLVLLLVCTTAAVSGAALWHHPGPRKCRFMSMRTQAWLCCWFCTCQSLRAECDMSSAHGAGFPQPGGQRRRLQALSVLPANSPTFPNANVMVLPQAVPHFAGLVS